MLLLAFAAPVLGTNCYILARDGSSECLLVDPGIGVDSRVEEILAEHALSPVAALVTHGHLDHTFALAQLCRRRDLPVYIHAHDAYRLDDPLGSLGPQLAQAFGGLADDWAPPPTVRTVRGGERLDLAGIGVHVLHAPGHTEGSVLYHLPGAEVPAGETTAGGTGAGLCFTGDVLFQGTIGRTDLPGGDHGTMVKTLSAIATPEDGGGLPDATIVRPGHGEPSTIGVERATNPFLRGLR